MGILDAIDKFKKRLLVLHRPATYSYYTFYFNLMARYLSDVNIHKITEDTLLEFIITLKKHHPKMKNITINKTLSALKTTLKYGANIRMTFQRLSESKTIIPVIPKATVNQVISYLETRIDKPVRLRNFLIVKILLETGIRMNELIHLEKHQIDLNHLTIQIERTKTHHHRIVCFQKPTEMYLRKWMALHPQVIHLFYNLRTFQMMTTSSIESMFYQLKVRQRIIENITPHKWRHTFATEFLRKGGDLETLRMLMGHSNLKTTQQYLHLSKQDIVKTYQSIMSQKDN